MSATTHPAGAVFDVLADSYDEDFTRSLIGWTQRRAVWRVATKVLHGRRHVLELNCGTGEDALFLARHGHQVTALDASAGMIARAEDRKAAELPHAPMHFLHLPIEKIAELQGNFDAVFSNFSGLNCVADLRPVAEHLAQRTGAGAPLLLCLSTRICVWETFWHLLHGCARKAFRRWSGSSLASLQGLPLNVFYPTTAQVRRAFGPNFQLRSITAIGLFVPPSYAAPWAKRHPRVFRTLRRLDTRVASWPLLRVLGDHVLLHFERRHGAGA